MHKIANSSARGFVQRCEEFNGSSLFARWKEDIRQYVVYSYGSHWPMFIWEDGAWYETSGKYSQTTTRHHSHCHPHCDTILLTPLEMSRVLSYGARKFLLERLKGEPAYA